MLLITTDYITQVCRVCSTSQSCTCPCDTRCSELEREVLQGLFLLLFVARWECGLSVARFLVVQEKSQIFFKRQTTPTFTYWLKFKKMHQICIGELLGSWITCLQSFSLVECLVETVQSFFVFNSILCSEYFSGLVNNPLTQHFCPVMDCLLCSLSVHATKTCARHSLLDIQVVPKIL